MTTDEKLVKVLGRARAVLFDFDGPICSVFAGEPAPGVARDLRDRLAEWDVAVQLNGELAEDPLEVLRAAVRFGDKVTRTADDLLTGAEISAARSAEPTPGGVESLRACRAAGLRVAVVSNNSAAAVNEYLEMHHLVDLVEVVIGREYGKPDLMKPHPKPIHDALKRLHIGPDVALLVGDSLTDVDGSRAAGIACIAYANKPGKDRLLAAADAQVDDMHVLADHLSALARRNAG